MAQEVIETKSVSKLPGKIDQNNQYFCNALCYIREAQASIATAESLVNLLDAEYQFEIEPKSEVIDELFKEVTSNFSEYKNYMAYYYDNIKQLNMNEYGRTFKDGNEFINYFMARYDENMTTEELAKAAATADVMGCSKQFNKGILSRTAELYGDRETKIIAAFLGGVTSADDITVNIINTSTTALNEAAKNGELQHRIGTSASQKTLSALFSIGGQAITQSVQSNKDYYEKGEFSSKTVMADAGKIGAGYLVSAGADALTTTLLAAGTSGATAIAVPAAAAAVGYYAVDRTAEAIKGNTPMGNTGYNRNGKAIGLDDATKMEDNLKYNIHPTPGNEIHVNGKTLIDTYSTDWERELSVQKRKQTNSNNYVRSSIVETFTPEQRKEANRFFNTIANADNSRTIDRAYSTLENSSAFAGDTKTMKAFKEELNQSGYTDAVKNYNNF